jgi:hypothetical protein
LNSSTSNSEPGTDKAKLLQARKTRWRAACVVALFFVLLEIFTRTKLMRMSKDLVRFPTYSAQAAELAGKPGFRVAFVGNSAVEKGVDSELVTAEAGDFPLRHGVFMAQGSHINTWHYFIKRYFWTPNHQPDLMVITFYERIMEDGHPDDIGRLAQYFTTRDDWGEVMRTDLPDFSHRVEFLLSTVWATYAVRDRLKERILGTVTPNYKPFAEKINALAFAKLGEHSAAPHTPSYQVLRRLLQTAQRHGTRLCFVAFPTYLPSRSGSYSLDPEMLRLIREARMEFLDLRNVAGLSPQHYTDDIHLTPDGAKIYTRALMNQLLPLLQRTGQGVALTPTPRRAVPPQKSVSRSGE